MTHQACPLANVRLVLTETEYAVKAADNILSKFVRLRSDGHQEAAVALR